MSLFNNRPTFASVSASLSKLANQFKEAAEHHAAAHSELQAKAQKLEAEAVVVYREATQQETERENAIRAAAKIASLIS